MCRSYIYIYSAFFVEIKNYIQDTYIKMGACGGAVGLGTALQAGRSRVRFPMVSLEFFIDILLPAAMRTKNIFWGVKAAGA